MANVRLEGKEQFPSKSYLLKMPCSFAKMRLKSAPQKLNFVMPKAVSKSAANTHARFRIVTHRNTASFSIKTALCKTNNNFFARTIKN